MVNQFAKNLSFYILFLINTSVFSSAFAATEVTLPANQPVVFTNTSTTTINALCVVHLVSQQTVSIKIISGKGSFNGTTFTSGHTLTALLYNGQSVPIIASKGTQAKITNLGPYVMKATC